MHQRGDSGRSAADRRGRLPHRRRPPLIVRTRRQLSAIGDAPISRRLSCKAGFVRGGQDDAGMAQNFLGCDHVKTSRGWVQGYNAQAVTTEDQIVIAADVTVDSPDFGHLDPMITAARRELERAGVTAGPEVVVADAGYWHQVQMEQRAAGRAAHQRLPLSWRSGGLHLRFRCSPGWTASRPASSET